MNLFQQLMFRAAGIVPDGYLGDEPPQIASEPAPPEVKAIDTADAGIAAASVAYAGAGGVRSSWTESRAIRDGFTVSTWVFSCLNRLMRGVASVPWVVKERMDDGSWERVPGHPIETLLSRPNPLQSRQQLMERLVAHMYLAGNALAHKVRGVGDRPIELWLVSPDTIRPRPHPTDVIRDYQVTSRSTGPRYVAVGDVIHWQFTNPGDPLWGMSPLQVAARAVDADVAAQDWQLNSMHNRATPDGVVSFKSALNEAQYKAAVRSLNDSRTGPANARSIAVIGGDASWMQLSLSPLEMDFLNSRKMGREEVCAVMGVPPPLIGLYENATLANLDASRAIFWQETIIPLLDAIADTLTMTLAPEWETTPDELRVVPDLTDVPALRALVRESTAAAQAMFALGVPLNVINDRLGLGLPYIEGGDIGLVNAGLVPASYLDPLAPGPSIDDGDGSI